MTNIPSILSAFDDWANRSLRKEFENVKHGIADQTIENVAWANIRTPNAVSGIKLWDTGDFYLEILTLSQEEPELAEFGKMPNPPDFSFCFKHLLDRIHNIEKD